MTLTAHIEAQNGQPWLLITAPPHHQGGTPLLIFDAPLNLQTKATTKLEIDWAHDKTGMPRPDLYDAVRDFQQREKRRHQAA